MVASVGRDHDAVHVRPDRLDVQTGPDRIRKRPCQQVSRVPLALMAARQTEADLDIDPRLLEPGGCGQLERARSSIDRG